MVTNTCAPRNTTSPRISTARPKAEDLWLSRDLPKGERRAVGWRDADRRPLEGDHDQRAALVNDASLDLRPSNDVRRDRRAPSQPRYGPPKRRFRPALTS